MIITSKAIVEGVHFYGNVTLGIRNGGSPVIKRNVKIAGNAMVLGAVVIGEGAIIAPGAIVFNDVPSGKIAGGIPAKIIGTVNKDNYDF